LLEHHVEEEEDEAFEKAREVFSAEELDAMGEEFERKKQALMR
jgi:hemerythrin-like domain-containing protein